MKILKKPTVFIIIILLACQMLSIILTNPVYAYTEGPSAGLQAFQWNSNDITTVIYPSEFQTNPSNGTYTGPYDMTHPKYTFEQPWGVEGSVQDITQDRKGYGGSADITGWQHGVVNTQTGTIHSRVRMDPDDTRATQSISYDVLINNTETGKTEVYRVNGIVKAYKVFIEVTLEPNTNGADSFDDLQSSGDPWTCSPALKDVTLWYNINTNVWDNCVDPVTGHVSNNAQNVPLSMYLTDVITFVGGQDTRFAIPNWIAKPTSGGTQPFQPTSDIYSQCVVVSPANSGDAWELYKSPSTQELLTDRWSTTHDYSINAVNMTKQLLESPNNISPFKEFMGSLWFKVKFTLFRPHADLGLWTLNEMDFPSIGFIGEMYYLQLGTFVYEQGKEDKGEWTWEGWHQVFGPGHYLWEGVFGILGLLNPFRVFGPFQGLMETIFWILLFGFGLWVVIKLWNKATGGKFNPYDFLKELKSGAGSVARSTREYALETYDSIKRRRKKSRGKR